MTEQQYSLTVQQFSVAIHTFVATFLIVVPATESRSAIRLLTDNIAIDNSSLPTTIHLEVYADLDPTADVTFSAFQVRANMDGITNGISVVSAGRPQMHPYSGPGQQPVVSIAGNRIDAGDISFTGYSRLLSGEGLVRVDLLVSAGTPSGFYQLRVDQDPNYTFIANDLGNGIPLVIASGGIRIVDIGRGDYDRNLHVNYGDYLVWRGTYGTSVATGSDADGNRDGMVDAADCVLWRHNNLQIAGDFDFDGKVDTADYVLLRNDTVMGSQSTEYYLWRSNFGRSDNIVGSSFVPVPEPVAGWMLLSVLVPGTCVIRVRWHVVCKREEYPSRKLLTDRHQI